MQAIAPRSRAAFVTAAQQRFSGKLGCLEKRRDLAARVEDTLTTVEALERHEGHLLNWYDTQTLAPLAPRYVSTVDSGNLAGAWMALSAGLREVAAASLADADSSSTTR